MKANRAVLTLLASCLALTIPTYPQTAPQGSSAAAAAPTAGVRAEVLDGLKYFEQRYATLAEAVPPEKFTWRPGEGVRSIAEVYLHVSAANYNLPSLIGTSPPAGLDVRGLEKSTTDKAKIIQTLHESFAHIRGAVLSLSDADVDKKLKLFGQDTTDRGAMIFMLRHLGEHLGQSIAYARMNNVVPPWTEEQQRRQQQQQQKPPEKPKQ